MELGAHVEARAPLSTLTSNFALTERVVKGTQPHSSTPALRIPIIRADVTILHEIGAGGFGTVYSARWSQMGELPIALKMVGHGGCADDIADIERERAVHERLFSTKHTANRLLIQLHGYFHEPARSLLLMELASDHVELDDHVAQQPCGRLNEGQAIRLAALLSEAIERCHDMDVAHLDIMPRNVLVSPCGYKLKLIDYGGGAVYGSGSQSSHYGFGLFGKKIPPKPSELTVEGSGWVTDMGGCPNYRSPERHLADHAVEGDDTRFFAPVCMSSLCTPPLATCVCIPCMSIRVFRRPTSLVWAAPSSTC